jgi:uncharacterized tellurite resistance protein B-like protein
MTNNKHPETSQVSEQLTSGGHPHARSSLGLGTDAAIAAAIVLFEVASADPAFNKFSRGMVHSALQRLFGLSEVSADAVINEAKNHLRNMRGSSSEALLLRDALDPITKRELAQTMDNIIRSNGVVEGVEVYLRQRFRMILGLPETPFDWDGAPPTE